jgi:iron complex outermembrane receptor protein
VPTHIRDYGYYASDRVSAFDDKIQVVAGLRSTDYLSTTATTAYNITGKLNPLFSAAFKPTQNSSIYGSYLKGLEAGGNAPNGTTNAGSVLPPLTSTQKEIGSKVQLFGGLLAQLGLFEIERPSAFTDPATNTFVANGLARFRGLEVFFSGEVRKNLSLVASLQDLDARQVKALNATTLNKTPEGTARYTESVFAEWRTPVQGLGVSLGTYYIGRRPVNSSDQGYVGGYTTYTAGCSYSFKIGNVAYAARVTVDNLTNKNAWAATGASLLGVTAPRLAKFSLKASF